MRSKLGDFPRFMIIQAPIRGGGGGGGPTLIRVPIWSCTFWAQYFLGSPHVLRLQRCITTAQL